MCNAGNASASLTFGLAQASSRAGRLAHRLTHRLARLLAYFNQPLGHARSIFNPRAFWLATQTLPPLPAQVIEFDTLQDQIYWLEYCWHLKRPVPVKIFKPR